jgi:hypothetical protein
MLDEMKADKLIFVGGRWHVARLIDYGHIGMGWGDPETTGLICVAGDEERVAALPSGAEPVGYVLPQHLDNALFQITVYRIRSVAEAHAPQGSAVALYASPQSSSQVTEGMVTRACKEAGWVVDPEQGSDRDGR